MVGPNLDMKLGVEIVFLRPDDPGEIGAETLHLAVGLTRFGSSGYRTLARSVRAGFLHNFATESSPVEGPWKALHKMTVDDRQALIKNNAPGLVPGFTSEHPILQRTGDYKRSWTSRDHEHHIERIIGGVESGGASFFGNLGTEEMGISSLADANEVIIEVGSEHPKAPTLEAGEPPAEIIALQKRMEAFGDIVEDVTIKVPNVPPRPVRFIGEQFENQIWRHVTRFLDVEARKVK